MQFEPNSPFEGGQRGGVEPCGQLLLCHIVPVAARLSMVDGGGVTEPQNVEQGIPNAEGNPFCTRSSLFDIRYSRTLPTILGSTSGAKYVHRSAS